MASGRFLSRALGGSRKYGALTGWHDGWYAACLYDHLVLHADAYGRVDADPIWINGQVMTRRPVPAERVNEALHELERVGLIALYEVDGNPYLEIAKFHEHNTLYLEREPQATIPFPDGTLPPEKPKLGPGEKRGNTRAGPEHGCFKNSARTVHAQCAHSADKVRGKRSRSEVEVEVEVEEKKTPPTPPQPEPLSPQGELPNPADLNSGNTTIWWMQYGMHPTGSEIAARVTKNQLRITWGPHEAVRLAKLRTPEFVRRAWEQAERDANRNPQRVFALIIEGSIAPTWKQPKPKNGLDLGSPATHPTHGQVTIAGHIPGGYLITLPTGETIRTEAAALA